MKSRLFVLFFLIVISQNCIAVWSIREGDPKEVTPRHAIMNQVFPQKEWDAYPFASQEKMEWFRDARYGFFVCHGLSCLWGQEVGWPRRTRKYPDRGIGGIPDAVYDGGIKELKMEHFDAEAIVGFAKKAGFKYIVVIAKHHDGFHMWDTKYSNHKITNSPFGRDYIGEFANACHKLDMPIGIYYSQRDWFHPDYEPILKTTGKPGPNHHKYIEYMHNTVRELLTNYGKIDIFWWDSAWWGGMFTADMWDADKIEKEIRKLQPNIIINNRASVPGDFDTPEQRIGSYQKRPWETCIPIGANWAWSPGSIKSIKQVLRLLISTSVGNGNLLLSTGFMPDGKLDPAHLERMLEVGEWLKQYGNTLYGTRGGPWYPGGWGGSTYRGNKVYLHIMRWPGSGKALRLPIPDQKIVGSKLLTSNGKVKWTYTPNSIDFEVAEADRDKIDTIVELTLDGSVQSVLSSNELPSIFDELVYGEIISSNATLKLSSVSKKWDNPAEYFRLFRGKKAATGFAFCTEPEAAPYAISILVLLKKSVASKSLTAEVMSSERRG